MNLPADGEKPFLPMIRHILTIRPALVQNRIPSRAIAETGYDQYVGHEFRPKGDPVEALRRAFALCDIS